MSAIGFRATKITQIEWPHIQLYLYGILSSNKLIVWDLTSFRIQMTEIRLNMIEPPDASDSNGQ